MFFNYKIFVHLLFAFIEADQVNIWGRGVSGRSSQVTLLEMFLIGRGRHTLRVHSGGLSEIISLNQFCEVKHFLLSLIDELH